MSTSVQREKNCPDYDKMTASHLPHDWYVRDYTNRIRSWGFCPGSSSHDEGTWVEMYRCRSTDRLFYAVLSTTVEGVVYFRGSHYEDNSMMLHEDFLNRFFRVAVKKIGV